MLTLPLISSKDSADLTGYKCTFHSYWICRNSKTAWLAGVFMVVGDGGKRLQSIVSLWAKTSSLYCPWSIRFSDFQIFRSSVNSVKGYKIFGYKYTFHSYGICWTSKTAWLAGIFMVVGDGGKRRQSIVSLWAKTSSLYCPWSLSYLGIRQLLFCGFEN